ncbi:MAG: sigma-54-dependent Fis family transcriptional regulator [Deltaproteobacteria bacterium]|nr:sigma-54-dependent Fis family transcriptional regulator [Deltaproteobacteria bacterium]
MNNQEQLERRFMIRASASDAILQVLSGMLRHHKDVVVEPSEHPCVFSAASVAQAIVCEIGMPIDDELLQTVAALRKNHQSVPFLALSCHPHHADAVALTKAGCTEYLAWPDEKRKLAEVLEQNIVAWRTELKRTQFVSLAEQTYDVSQIIGRSPQMRRVFTYLEKATSNPALTVLITGETGTGKELIAKAIHYNSENRLQPFVEIGCSVIPENLLESELFGHEKGAFTDARQQKKGLFEVAGRGTIFLDEIGDISPAIQSKLIKVTEEKKMRRLGGVHDIPVYARIIAATSKDLEEMVESGTFRKDLYYRLNVLTIGLPPLRERRTDIPLLANHYLEQFAKLFKKGVEGFSEGAMNLLMQQSWEGNVRELKHAVERAVLLSESRWIEPSHFDNLPHFDDSFSPAEGHHIQLDPGAMTGSLHIDLSLEDLNLTHVEKLVIRAVLKRFGGNKSRTARVLNISRPRLDRIISQDPGFFKS